MNKFMIIFRQFEYTIGPNGEPSQTCVAMTSQLLEFRSAREQDAVLNTLSKEAEMRGMAIDIIELGYYA